MISDSEKATKIEQLLEAKKDISDVFRRHKTALTYLKNDKIQTQSISDILFFAENITPTSFAPKGWVFGCNLGHPPAPQIENMRKGFLGEKIMAVNLSTMPEPLGPESEDIDSSSILEQSDSRQEIELHDRKRKFDDVAEEIKMPLPVKEPSHRFQVNIVRPAAKVKQINMNYGFSSGSDTDSDSEKD
jgi:hypothetical protein